MLRLGPEGQQKSWWDKALGYDGDGHLAATEHKAGIERVTGPRLESGCGYGSGRESRFGYYPYLPLKDESHEASDM